jgi:polar amino acid transport system substrate-binding protein
MFSRYYYLLSLLIVLLLLAACVQPRPQKDDTVAEKGKTAVLKVGVSPTAPPLVFLGKNGITGLEAEMARGIAKMGNRELHLVNLDWDEQINALEDGQIDIIMSGMSITKMRNYRIAFTKPYLVTGQVSLVRRPDLRRFGSGTSDLMNPNLRIGTVKGTTGQLFIEQTIHLSGKQSTYSTAEKGVAALLENDIDVFVYDLPMNFYFAAQNESNGLAPVVVPMTREHLAWGVRKDDPETLQLANAYLESIQQSGQLQEMILRWIPFYKNIMRSK